MKYGAKRFVNIRGYVKEVTVCKQNSKGEWIVIDGNNTEAIAERDFYHKNQGGVLIGRGTPEFLRKYPDHPIEKEIIIV